jgi:hypothetical protein
MESTHCSFLASTRTNSVFIRTRCRTDGTMLHMKGSHRRTVTGGYVVGDEVDESSGETVVGG